MSAKQRSVSLNEVREIAKETARIQSEAYSGPIPSPRMLQEYEQLYPGAAKDIFEQFKKQTDHRISVENRVIDSNIKNERRGSWFAFIITMTAIVGGIALTFSGMDGAGVIVASGGLASLVAVFITGKLVSIEHMRRKT